MSFQVQFTRGQKIWHLEPCCVRCDFDIGKDCICPNKEKQRKKIIEDSIHALIYEDGYDKILTVEGFWLHKEDCGYNWFLTEEAAKSRLLEVNK